MEIISSVNLLKKKLETLKGSVGFVPTMGALHQGHISLVERAKQENQIVVVSIFVNPTQFNENSDLLNYPRPIENDARLAQDAGADILFTPEVNEIYPEGKAELLKIDLGEVERVMEGAFRPGHFDGVKTVVYRLFDLVKPRKAYFGEKDFQQLSVVKAMVNKLKLPIEIIPCETVRENDGLAMSSRNTRLNKNERESALSLYESLKFSQKHKNTKTPEQIKSEAMKLLKNTVLVHPEYFEIVDEYTLQPVWSFEPQGNYRACVAARVGDTRLIDNIRL